MCRPILPPDAALLRAILLATWKPPSSGVVLYEGPSALDGAPIVVVLTFRTDNRKTGPMAQTWILRRDVAPHDAQRTEDDRSVCGNCPQRPAVGGACYVATFQGPLSVWKAYHRGLYPRATEVDRAAIRDRYRVRAGAYGDPAALPASVWASVGVWTGYTHQWREEHAQDLRAVLMASADSEHDAREAWANGWRTFRVLQPGEAPIAGAEIVCLSDSRGISCFQCGLCGGLQTPGGKSIAIMVHGARAPRGLTVLQ